jgi:hypothetical protein
MLQVTGTSATQAVLHYQAPDGNPCQVQISPNASMTPLAEDVDPQLFIAANQDIRAGSAFNSTDRVFVAGKRRSDVALDGRRHSRALQAFTPYYVSVVCNGIAATTQFATVNPPLGNNYPEPPPFDPRAFGNYAWPSIDWNDQSKTYIDPLTGIALKRATGPGWYGWSQTGKKFGTAIDLTGAWNNVSNLLSGSNTTLASYSGMGGDAVFAAFDPAQLTGPSGGQFGSWYPLQSLDGVLIRVFGTGNGAILGCLSADSGASCLSPTYTLATLGLGTGNPAGTYPAACASDSSRNCFPNDGFWGGWNVTPLNGEMSALAGVVNVSGTAVTPVGQTPLFSLNWKPGGKVFIAGSAPACANNLCTIAMVNSSSSMSIQENAGTFNAASFKTANTGVKLWVAQARTGRRSPATLTANISINFDYAYSDSMSMPANGTVSQCSPIPTTVSYAADGVTPITPVPGQLCLAGHNSNPGMVLYLLIPSTGETRLLSPIWFVNSNDAPADQAADPVGGTIQVPGAAFDTTDPNTIYAGVNTNGGVSIFRGVYNAAANKYKAYGHSLYPSQSGGYNPGGDTTQAWFRAPGWADSGITWTNITKASQGLDLGSQIAANDRDFSANLFHAPTVTQIAQGRAFTVNFPMSNAGSESLSLIHAFDLSTGRLVQSANTWSLYPDRWCAMHATVALEGWYGLICNPVGGAEGFKPYPGVMGSGPWQMTPTAVLKNGSFSADTSITASAPQDACPAIPASLQALAPPNPYCITFQSQMACSVTPYPGENIKWPCEYNPNYSEVQPLAPGDNILMVNGTNIPESLMILSVTSLGSAMYQFTAIRFGSPAGGVGSYSSAPNGWTGIAMPPATTCNYPVCTPGVGMWFSTTQNSVNWQVDPWAFGSHSDLGQAPTPGANSYCQTLSCRFNIPFSQQLGTYPNTNFSGGSFQGVSGAIGLQGYPSLRQLTAPASEQVWMTNFRHLNPSYGSGAEVPSPVGPVSYALVPGTQGVFKFTAINGGVSYKQAPVEGYAGYHLLQDVSSPAQGDTIADATPWQFCVVLNAGECQTGSNPGEAYASVPQGVVHSSQNCIANWYDDNYPCLFTPPAQAAWGIQQGIAQNDPAGQYWRPITMGFSGPGRQFEFGSFIPDPTGTWAFMQGYWPDGARNDLFMARLPPWPTQSDSIDRSHYVPLTISVAANSAQPLARLHFGYAENGAPSSFYCTARQDACTAIGTPFSFDSENPQWQDCTNGCSLQVPEIAGRVLYYEIDRQDANGNTTPGPLQVNILP